MLEEISGFRKRLERWVDCRRTVAHIRSVVMDEMSNAFIGVRDGEKDARNEAVVGDNNCQCRPEFLGCR